MHCSLTVTVHFFEDENYHPVEYDFGEKIPVSISGGECTLDFSRILRGISSYYE